MELTIPQKWIYRFHDENRRAPHLSLEPFVGRSQGGPQGLPEGTYH